MSKGKETKKEIINEKVAIDGGNSSIKVIYKDNFIRYENYFAKNIEIDYSVLDIEGNLDEELRNFLNVKFIWHNGEEDQVEQDFLFGEIAANYSAEAEERLNTDKSDDITLNMTSILSAVNFMIENTDKSELKEEMEFNIALGTGIPFHEYKEVERREKYKNHFLGQHIIEFKDPRYQAISKVKRAIVNINSVDVESEGVSALDVTVSSQGLISQENEDRDFLLDTVVSLIDIGGYTTDIVSGIVRERKHGYILDRAENICYGYRLGVNSQILKSISEIIKKLGGKITSNFKLTVRDVLIAEAREGRMHGIVNRKFNINSTDYTYSKYEELGKEIGNKYTQLLVQASQIDNVGKVYISGGGSMNDIIATALVDTLVSKGIDRENIEILTSPHPLYVNSVGYYFAIK